MRQAFPVAVRLWPWIGKADIKVFEEITNAGARPVSNSNRSTASLITD